MKTRIGSLITDSREKLSYSQSRLAREAGISHGYMSQIEKGDRIPSSKVLRRIARVLGVPSYELEQAAGNITAPELDYVRAFALEKLGRTTSLVGTSEEAPAPSDATTPGGLLEVLLTMMPELATQRGPSAAAPEGWSELSAEDRRLVQQMVNRLRAEDKRPARKRGKK